MASPIPTPFHVGTRHGSFYGSCIWDALGIVAMLGGDGTVRTWCPDCGDRLAVEVTDDAPVSGDGLAHHLVPASRWWDDVGSS